MPTQQDFSSSLGSCLPKAIAGCATAQRMMQSFIPILGNTGRSDEESEWVKKTDRAGLKSWEKALEVKLISLTSSRSELRNQGSGNYINSLKEGNGLGTIESSGNESHWMLLHSVAGHFGLLNLITPLWKNLSARPWQNVLSLPSARHMEICNLLFVPLTLFTQGRSFVQWICMVIMPHHALARWVCATWRDFCFPFAFFKSKQSPIKPQYVKSTLKKIIYLPTHPLWRWSD